MWLWWLWIDDSEEHDNDIEGASSLVMFHFKGNISLSVAVVEIKDSLDSCKQTVAQSILHSRGLPQNLGISKSMGSHVSSCFAIELTVAAHNVSEPFCLILATYLLEPACMILEQDLVQEPQFICKCHESVWCINTWQWLLRFSKTCSHRLLVSSYKWVSTVLIYNPLQTLGVALLAAEVSSGDTCNFPTTDMIRFIQSEDTTMDPGKVKRLCLLADGWCGIWAKTHSTHLELWSLWFVSTSSQWTMCTKERWIKDELRLHIKFGLIFGVERSVKNRPFAFEESQELGSCNVTSKGRILQVFVSSHWICQGLLHFIATKVVPSFADVACGEEKCDRETWKWPETLN